MTTHENPDGKVELFSPEWIDLARGHLEEAVAKAGRTLDGVKFEICEVATDPPARLAMPGTNKVAWHVVFDGPTVKASPGEIDCPFKVEVDYQSILPLARTVYADHPEALSGRQAERATSGLPDIPTPLQPILLGLHDFLARRTA